MIESVNNLIYNTIISEGAVHLPSVGTLYIERRTATLERRVLTAPSRVIAFSSHLKAKSIVDVICDVSSVDTKIAEEIYGRWLDKVRSSSDINIDGVGVIKNKTFITDNKLITSLNFGITSPIRASRKRGSAAHLTLLLIPIIAIAGYVLYNNRDMILLHTTVEPQMVDSVTLEQAIEPTHVDNIVTNASTVTEPKPELEIEKDVEIDIEESKEAITVDWREQQNIRHRVVVGSYSTKENAERAVRDIEQCDTSLSCAIFELGTMYSVAIYGSSERSECEEFARLHKNNFSQLWIYTPKRYR